jgi:hypothetical protein
VRPAQLSATLDAFVGCLKKKGAPKLTLEQMKKIAREGWAGER